MSKKQVGGYVLDKKIGKGSFAAVWKGHRVENAGDVVAIKVISRQTVHETTQLKQEVSVLKQIHHPHIVRFRDLKKSAGHFYLILEYCSGGDLAKFIRTRGCVSEDIAMPLLTQLADGLRVLHSQNFIHRDLKPQNILLTDESDYPVLKIADFGFARALMPQDMAATICGSPLYMAPEILRHEKYDARADLWSVGTILYELLYGAPPFTASNPMALLKLIESSDSVSSLFPDDKKVTDECKTFLKSLLVTRPQRRLSTRLFFGHKYGNLAADPTTDPPGSESLMLRELYSVVEQPSAEMIEDEDDDSGKSSKDGRREKYPAIGKSAEPVIVEDYQGQAAGSDEKPAAMPPPPPLDRWTSNSNSAQGDVEYVMVTTEGAPLSPPDAPHVMAHDDFVITVWKHLVRLEADNKNATPAEMTSLIVDNNVKTRIKNNQSLKSNLNLQPCIWADHQNKENSKWSQYTPKQREAASLAQRIRVVPVKMDGRETEKTAQRCSVRAIGIISAPPPEAPPPPSKFQRPPGKQGKQGKTGKTAKCKAQHRAPRAFPSINKQQRPVPTHRHPKFQRDYREKTPSPPVERPWFLQSLARVARIVRELAEQEYEARP
eukprot:gene1271-1132_t